MNVSGFSRINTRIRPGSELATITVSESMEQMLSPETIGAELESIRHSVDGVAIIGDGCDPLSDPGLFRIIKSIGAKGMEILIVSDGRNPSNLDDLVGAGYVDFLVLVAGPALTDTQLGCIDVMRDNNKGYMLSLEVSKDSFDVDAISSTCKKTRDSRHTVIRNGKGTDAVSNKDLQSLTKSLKGLVRDLKIV